VSELLLNPQVAKRPEAVAEDCLGTLERHWLDRRLRDLKRQLEPLGIAALDRSRLQKQVETMTRRRQELLYGPGGGRPAATAGA
jgi:hypothetical protein